MGVIWQDLGALTTVVQESSGSTGDEIVETSAVYSRANYSSLL